MRARPAGRKIRPVARYRVTAEHALCRGSHRTFALLPRRWWRRWAECSGAPSTGLRPLAERGVRPKVTPPRLAHRYRNQSAPLVARSEESRVGKGIVKTVRLRLSTEHENTK